ncbi:aldo/keto reductase [Gracilibacillus sp. HCP3S3_G5_1]|uniref:aldo/keto reductase n=1 Tax=unclassified Gracilibacillus TaxID=2625209 RepID=UPI003F8A66A4
MPYIANQERYQQMTYNRCGDSGLLLPAISLGLYRNFGEDTPYDQAKEIILTAFDNGITHFDLANNYGESNGSAESLFGQIVSTELSAYRDELIIATKAGYEMWPGPYGDGGSRKYLLASLDQSLQRLGIDYVDIYYSHRYDQDTPLEETISALDTAVKQGKALYAGVSNYPADIMEEVIPLFKQYQTPFVVHQTQYSMFLREPEDQLFPLLEKEGLGAIVYQPLFQGLLSTKYQDGIPEGSRIAQNVDSISSDQITPDRIAKVQQLKEIADNRGQSVPQLAIAWVLKRKSVSSALIGVRNVEQLIENRETVENLSFTHEEVQAIDSILS